MVSSGTVIRILVVDDYEPFRRVLREALQKRLELHVIGEASDGLEAVRSAQDLKPDLVLLDIGLPQLNGIEVAHRISRFVPEAKILFVSQNNDPDLVKEALNNGARGYVWKSTVNEDLLLAIEAVLRGDHFVSSRLGW